MANNNAKRGRNQRRRQGHNMNRALDSNGPDVKIRGTATQIYDKYQTLARDAHSAGDRIRAENLLQHAEHYYRILKAMQPAQPVQSPEYQAEQPVCEGGTLSSVKDEPPSDAREGEQEAAPAETSDEEVSDSGEPVAAQGEKLKRPPRRRRLPRKPLLEGTEPAQDRPAVSNEEKITVAT